MQAVTEQAKPSEHQEIPDIKGIRENLEAGKEVGRKTFDDLEVKRKP